MAANNQGIVHLRMGGWAGRSVACKRRDTHMSVPAEKFDAEARKCKRCEAKWAKMQVVAARRARQQ